MDDRTRVEDDARKVSTRLSIALQALDDIYARLAERDAPDAATLKSEADVCSRMIADWAFEAPSESSRAELVTRILALHLRVLRVEGR